MKKYVLGLAFTATGNQMVCIEKNRPEFQKGKWNGVGGKLKDDETLYDAMLREFQEETGCKTSVSEWKYFCKLLIDNDPLGGQAEIHCFRRFNNDVFQCKTNEDEKVELHTISDITSKLPVAPNLPMLIAIALNKNVNFVELLLDQNG